MLVVDYIESGIVPAAVQMLDQDSPDEFRAEGVMVRSLVRSTPLSGPNKIRGEMSVCQ